MSPTEEQVRALVKQILSRLQQGSSTAQAGGKAIIGADDLRQLAVGSRLDVPPGALITPLARDLARERNIELISTPAANAPLAQEAPDRTIAIAADHGGYALKEQLKPYLTELGYQVSDVGTHSSESVDYPDYAYAAASLVAQGKCAAAIIIDGAGIGSCMTANKVPGIRASMCYDVSTARNAREHNHANVLTLGAGLLGPGIAKQIVKTWLETPWGPGRHARRVQKIMDVERRFCKKP